MAAMIWDEQAQAYTESETPMKYDQTAGAWTDTTGMAWDNEAQAWTERWGTKVSAYVYGAVSETVTIRKNGIVVATVQTDASGCSTEKVSLNPGTYDMTGSVSGWTEEQTVDEDTDRFRAMPEGAIYWYGNQCTDITGGWTESYNSTVPASNIALETNCMSQKGAGSLRCTKNMVSRKGYSKFCSTMKWTSVNYDITYNIIGLDNNTYSVDLSKRSFQHQGHRSNVGEQYTPNPDVIYTFKNNNYMDSDHPTEAYVYNGNTQDGTYSNVYAIWFE